MIGDATLRARLADGWALPDAAITVHNGGMNSVTWFVDHEGVRRVAKAVVPDAARAFEAGLTLAAGLAAAGIASGAPVPTRDGRLTTDADGWPLALLTWVSGEPLTRDSLGAQPLIGDALARVHRASAGLVVDGGSAFGRLDPAAEHLSVRPWIRGAVAGALDAFADLDGLTHRLLHGDPAPEAFRFDPASGVCGLIDWSDAVRGPLMYDVASAVMYVGGPDRAVPLLDAYLARGPLSSAEVHRGLSTMLRFRWAVQAYYFAYRLFVNDLTGIASTADNETGLEHARQGLARFT